MKTKSLINLVAIIAIIAINFFSISQEAENIFKALSNKNYIRAQELYESGKQKCENWEQKLIEATLTNAFNQPEQSNRIADSLLVSGEPIKDSIIVHVLLLKIDNYIKLLEYASAAKTIDLIRIKYAPFLTEAELADLSNDFTLWNLLRNEAKQVVHIPKTVKQKMQIDKAGLKNLRVSLDKDSIDFIFDTGANISTVTQTTAKKLNMKIIPANIEVGTITGQTILADLAVCPRLNIGEIVVKNAVFLVLSDQALHIEQIDYSINGIIGFPIINAFREIQITQDNLFIIPEIESPKSHPSNMALDELKPMIYMNGMHFSFDTGATESMMYLSFYLKHKQEIDSLYTEQEFEFGGAAGSKKFTGYAIPFTFDIMDKRVRLENLMVLNEAIKANEPTFGNIGQDIIANFQSMTINFNAMFIRFN